MRHYFRIFSYVWLAGLLLPAAEPALAQDAFGYTATNNTPYSYVDISSTGTSVLSGYDDGNATVQLGFTFSFYGASYTSICLSTNGDAGLGACPTGDAQNVDLTSQIPGGDTPLIAPFWTDLTFAAPGAGSVVYQTLGTSGSLRFVAQWNNAMALNSASPYNFQIVLSQGTNQILFQYELVDGGPAAVADGAGATVGIRAAGSQNSQFDYQWSYDAAVLTSGSAILFTPPSNTTCTSLTLSVSSLLYDANGGATTISITAPGSCPWTVTADSPWIVVSGATGKGNGAFPVTILPNSTGLQENGNLYVGSQTIPVTERGTAQVFADVSPADYYFDAVNLLATKGITHGCSTTDYCPAENVTRAEMAIFIVRAIIGSDNFTYNPAPYFNDVPATAFGFAWIQEMYELGITTGCGGGDYCPNSDVTRAQMAVFIIRMRYGATASFDYPPTPYFTDVLAGEFAFPWIQRMREDNILPEQSGDAGRHGDFHHARRI
jgi:hypothetical protein